MYEGVTNSWSNFPKSCERGAVALPTSRPEAAPKLLQTPLPYGLPPLLFGSFLIFYFIGLTRRIGILFLLFRSCRPSALLCSDLSSSFP